MSQGPVPSNHSMMSSDRELLEEALGGVEDAFTALYRRRQGSVYRFALQMTGSVAVAEDVTQETFLALLMHGGRYDESRGTLAAFLIGIARNLVMRRLDRNSRIELEITEDCAGSEDVLSLPPVFREAVVLCDLQDATYEEAASALACPVGTVRSRLSRARAMLARKLRGVALV